MEKGEVALVLGASGAVGQLAVQVAVLLGARRVIAASLSEEGLRRARELGANATVALGGRSMDQLTEDFREAAGGEIDVVIDPLWGEPAVAALNALGTGGRLVNLGQSAGADAVVSSSSVRGKMRSILGHANHMTPGETKREAYRTLLEHATAGRLVIDIETLPLEEVTRAWEEQAASPHRKMVLRP
jgi:NADPH:quinone reductase